jgi:FkbM family methyltransferase
MYENSKAVTIRGTEIFLHTYNRSLDLCARMNYEVEVLEFIDSLTAADVLYDLGAAEGRFAIYAAAKGLHVIAFEPENRNFQVFSDNIKLNPAATPYITAHNLAVGAANAQSTIVIGQPWAGGHQKVVSNAPGRIDFNFKAIEEQPITIVALDNFIRSTNSPAPTAIKIDVDGSEIPFIQGAALTLKSYSLRKMIFELCVADQSYHIIAEQLNQHHFQETGRFKIPNEADLYNIIFEKNMC